MSQTNSVNVSTRIDNCPIGWFQLRIVALCSLVVALDGFDAQLLGYIAPAISEDWELPAGSLGPIFGLGLFGMMIGALVFGPVADRIGRKNIIIGATFFFAFCTLATLTAESLTGLGFWRFMTGIGLGAAYPNAMALTSEFSPKRRRAMLVMLMFLGFGLGSAIGGAVAAMLLADYGWQSMLWVGGIVPIVVAFALIPLLSESPTFLVVRGGRDNLIRSILRKIDPSKEVSDDSAFCINKNDIGGQSVKNLFTGGRSLGTLMLWVMFSGGLFSLYFLMAWLPTIIYQMNVSLENAALITANMQVAVTIATIVVALIADKIGIHRILPFLYFMAAVFIASIGLASTSGGFMVLSTTALVAVAVFFSGFFVGGGQNSANALASIYYPAHIRATGISWGHGVSRTASILGPVAGGTMLAGNFSIDTMFYLAAIPMACACVASLIFRVRYHARLSN
jgi:AAHS family 4-hydroxybenzoate transporter-like MFS transporter